MHTGGLSVDWNGSDEQHRELLHALREAVSNNPVQYIEKCIARDPHIRERASELRIDPDKPVNRTTIKRWLKPLDKDPRAPLTDDDIVRFRRATVPLKIIAYEFLCRSKEIHTSLRRRVPALPAAINAFVDDLNLPRERLRFDKLANLDGTYRLYRRAWTTPKRRDRVLISRLVIETVAGLTRFREEQDYKDDQRSNLHVQERDHGLVFNSGINVILLGFGQDEARIKFAVVDKWHPSIDGQKPVQELIGTMVGVNGEGPHPGYSFIAYRHDGPSALKSRVVDARDIPSDIARSIGCEI
jgi:hypothetical protein